jgi:hypothetical protein
MHIIQRAATNQKSWEGLTKVSPLLFGFWRFSRVTKKARVRLKVIVRTSNYTFLYILAWKKINIK